ncbi:MAG: Ig-like domain-containing protein, partial [bacterium]|nr:Ig-like domain-containing protein [bacterium]
MINIEPPAGLVSIEVNPEEVLLFSVGDARRINVRGTFADGVSRALTSSPETKFSSSNPKVARIAANGDLEAVAPGRATITVSHAGFSREVKVVVAGSEVRGDLDVDLDPVLDADPQSYDHADADPIDNGNGDSDDNGNRDPDHWAFGYTATCDIPQSLSGQEFLPAGDAGHSVLIFSTDLGYQFAEDTDLHDLYEAG